MARRVRLNPFLLVTARKTTPHNNMHDIKRRYKGGEIINVMYETRMKSTLTDLALMAVVGFGFGYFTISVLIGLTKNIPIA